MPCMDHEYKPTRRIRPNQHDRLLSKALCGVLTLLEANGIDLNTDIFANIDYKEAGIDRDELEEWWAIHKAEDARRREQERIEAEKAKLKAAALAKLTTEEKAVLGL